MDIPGSKSLFHTALVAAALLQILPAGELLLVAQDAGRSRTGDLIMSEKSKPLSPLGGAVFPDGGVAHRGAGASIFVRSLAIAPSSGS